MVLVPPPQLFPLHLWFCRPKTETSFTLLLSVLLQLRQTLLVYFLQTFVLRYMYHLSIAFAIKDMAYFVNIVATYFSSGFSESLIFPQRARPCHMLRLQTHATTEGEEQELGATWLSLPHYFNMVCFFIKSCSSLLYPYALSNRKIDQKR